MAVTPEAHWREVEERGTTDFGYAHTSGNRFRISVLRQRGRYAGVMRLIPNKLLTFDQIGLPEQIRELCKRPRGLVLVTGPTGSGKTTTLAGMIDHINNNREVHCVTIEDPIEVLHYDKLAMINQREVRVDTEDFSTALRAAMRQTPTSSWSARCVITRPSRRHSRRRRPVTSSCRPCTPPTRRRPSPGSSTSSCQTTAAGSSRRWRPAHHRRASRPGPMPRTIGSQYRRIADASLT
jgi:hypothetical protein